MPRLDRVGKVPDEDLDLEESERSGALDEQFWYSTKVFCLLQIVLQPLTAGTSTILRRS